MTYREIEADGFDIDLKVEMLLSSDSAVGISKSMGLGLIGFGEALQQLRPDLLLVLGDRFEIFSAVAAAMVARIPVAHLHGGEVTEGAFDEAIRHSITKMSHLHFVAAEPYRKRVIQLGEHPDRVILVGSPGIDAISRVKLLEKSELERSLGFKFGKRNLLITFHPVTLEAGAATLQMGELLSALNSLQNTNLIFTMPNADNESRAMVGMLEQFVAAHPNTHLYPSLGQQRYLSCIRYVDGVVGNSSSGLSEVPSFKKGTINIGDRQLGRLKASSVIDCQPEQVAISDALNRLYSAEFQQTLKSVINPYGESGASQRVVDILSRYPLDTIQKKSFYNL
jgi:GDP/UDP-N,N'-diacetylbacillosamine 2-epimerase (hydrolysing)